MNNIAILHQQNDMDSIFFSEAFYSPTVCGTRTPKIACGYRLWQQIVLHALVDSHRQNRTGIFYREPVVKSHGLSLRGVTFLDGIPVDQHGRGSTDHVVYISDVWKFTREQLTHLDVYFEEGSSDDDDGRQHERGLIYLSSAVLDYLNWLTAKGFLISLNTRLGFDTEHSFKLGAKFDQYV